MAIQAYLSFTVTLAVWPLARCVSSLAGNVEVAVLNERTGGLQTDFGDI